jgi:hypothetical protein
MTIADDLSDVNFRSKSGVYGITFQCGSDDDRKRFHFAEVEGVFSAQAALKKFSDEHPDCHIVDVEEAFDP